jgi:hypothetical protein
MLLYVRGHAVCPPIHNALPLLYLRGRHQTVAQCYLKGAIAMEVSSLQGLINYLFFNSFFITAFY